jgi:hypothetical protein
LVRKSWGPDDDNLDPEDRAVAGCEFDAGTATAAGSSVRWADAREIMSAAFQARTRRAGATIG